MLNIYRDNEKVTVTATNKVNGVENYSCETYYKKDIIAMMITYRTEDNYNKASLIMNDVTLNIFGSPDKSKKIMQLILDAQNIDDDEFIKRLSDIEISSQRKIIIAILREKLFLCCRRSSEHMCFY